MQKIKNIIITAVLLIGILWTVDGNAQTNLYVSVNGKDGNPGTQAVSNLKDLAQAQAEVIGKKAEIVVFRNQQQLKQWIEIKRQ